MFVFIQRLHGIRTVCRVQLHKSVKSELLEHRTSRALMMHTHTLLLNISTLSHIDLHLHPHSKSLSLQQEDCLEQVINDTECLFKSREKEYQETIDQIEVRHLLLISKLQIATIVLSLFYCALCIVC